MAIVLLASVEASSAADAAAQAGARAATREQTPDGARTAAERVVQQNTESDFVTCQIAEIEVGEMSPGQSVVVNVTCDSADAGFGGFFTLGRSYDAEAVEVVDAYRSGEPS